MSSRLYMDVHVASAVTEGLRRRGVDVLMSQEDGTRTATDVALLARAVELDRILFTQDEDLLAIAAEWQSAGRDFSGLVYAHPLGPGIGRIIEDVELLMQCAAADELRNQVVYLPLK